MPRLVPLLEWRDSKYGDRALLDKFECTDGGLVREYTPLGMNLVHPRMYEFEVQTAIQRLPLPKRNSSAALRLGLDAAGLAAVCFSRESDAGKLYELNFAALACRLRGKGGGYADEMLRDTFDVITARAAALGSGEVEVVAYVRPENAASQWMCRRNGLRHDSDLVEENFQVWKVWIPVSGAE